MTPVERLQSLAHPKQTPGEAELAQHIAFHPRIPLPVAEYRFCPPRRFRFDFAWPDYKLAVEVEGGVFRAGGGAHQRPGRFVSDMEKYNLASGLGWRVMRFSTEQVEAMHAFDAIDGYFKSRAA